MTPIVLAMFATAVVCIPLGMILGAMLDDDAHDDATSIDRHGAMRRELERCRR